MRAGKGSSQKLRVYARRQHAHLNGIDCQVDCDAVIGTPSRPSTLPPTMPTRPPTDNDSDGALGLTTTLTAAAVAVAAAF